MKENYTLEQSLLNRKIYRISFYAFSIHESQLNRLSGLCVWGGVDWIFSRCYDTGKFNVFIRMFLFIAFLVYLSPLFPLPQANSINFQLSICHASVSKDDGKHFIKITLNSSYSRLWAGSTHTDIPTPHPSLTCWRWLIFELLKQTAALPVPMKATKILINAKILFMEFIHIYFLTWFFNFMIHSVFFVSFQMLRDTCKYM